LRSLVRLTIAFTLLAPVAASAAAVVRGPYLQQTSAVRTIVVVRTDAAATVRAVADVGGGRTAVAQTSGTDHALVLEGLPAATSVPYRVEVDGAVAAEGVVRTPGAPATAAGRQAVLGVLGDFGTQGPIEHANVARLVERGVHAVLTVGDNAYPDGAPEDWDPALFRPLAPLLARATFWPVPGDHEYITPFAQAYLDAFVLPAGPDGERYYSFDWGDVHVVALDSNCLSPLDAATAGCTAASMLAWLDEDLAASRAPWKIALMHRPALATGRYGSFAAVQSALVPRFQEHGVDLVLQGHNHLYERTWPTRDGAPVATDYDRRAAPVYVTAGGGGDWLYDFELPAAPWTAYREKTDQHLVLTVDGGSLKVESVRSNGTVHDSFTITKDIPPLPVLTPDPESCSGEGCPPAGDRSAPRPDIPFVNQRCATGDATMGLLAVVALAGWAARRVRP
jgi:hypothetical protein